MIYDRGILLDSAAVYAIANKRDKYHTRATAHLNWLKDSKYSLLITNVTIYESYRLILHKLGIKNALVFLNDIFDGSVRIEYVTIEDEMTAKKYLNKYDDQSFTFIDTLNFSVMIRIGIAKIFTFDTHFQVVGFEQMPV
jgi:predicted nucleic acid-binding protein